MRFVLLNIILLMALGSFSQGPNSWEPSVDFASGQRDRTVAFSVHGKGYVSCGVDTADIVHNDLWEFDATTRAWTQKANLPGSPRRNAVAFTINDFGYVGTGVDNVSAPAGNILNDFWKYNALTNSWLSIASFPGGTGTGVYFSTAFTGIDKGYVCSGKIGPDSYIDEMWEYKPSIDQWTQRADFPGGPRFHMVSYSVSGRAFIGLGANEDVYLNDWWEYHTGTNIWSQKTDFPSAERGDCISFVLEGKGFIGLGTDGGYRRDLWEYNHHTDNWITRNDFPTPGRKYACAFVIADSAFVGLGKAATGRKRSFFKYFRGSIMNVEDERKPEFKVYPNPILSTFNIKDVSSDYKIVNLLALNGQVVQTFTKNESGRYMINNAISAGVYVLTIMNDQGIIGQQKVIVGK
jgi:N-acetylneuraminic acid mutarotase